MDWELKKITGKNTAKILYYNSYLAFSLFNKSIPVGKTVENANTKVMGLIPRKRMNSQNMYTLMQCELLCIKASAKCMNVNK